MRVFALCSSPNQKIDTTVVYACSQNHLCALHVWILAGTNSSQDPLYKPFFLPCTSSPFQHPCLFGFFQNDYANFRWTVAPVSVKSTSSQTMCLQSLLEYYGGEKHEGLRVSLAR
jgi:hypothetical protein